MQAIACSRGSALTDLLSRGLCDERLFFVSIKASRFVELKCGLTLSAGQKHNLVAPGRPGDRQRLRQYGLAVPFSPMCLVSDHIFDEAVRLAAAREIGNDGQNTTAHESVLDVPTKVVGPWIRRKLTPGRFNNRRWRQGLVRFVEVPIEPKQLLQVVEGDGSNVHSSGLT